MKVSRGVILAFMALLTSITAWGLENAFARQSATPANPPSVPAPTSSAAATGRIAVINTGAFSADDGITQLVAQLKRVNDQYREKNAEVEALKQQGDALQREIQTQGPNLTPQARADKQEKLDELQTDLQRKQQDFEKGYTKAVREATDPVVERVNAFLDNFCKQRGITLVLEAAVLYQARGLAYVDPGLDITREFIDAYNKSTAGASAQPSGGSTNQQSTSPATQKPSGPQTTGPATQRPSGTQGASNVRPPAPKKP